MKDSFRQAMSEMFMGDDPKKQQAAAGQGQTPQAAVPAAPASRPAPAMTGRTTTIKHVEQNPAEAQLSKMSRDISELKPEFTSPSPSSTPAPTSATVVDAKTVDASRTIDVPPGRSDGPAAYEGDTRAAAATLAEAGDTAGDGAKAHGPVRSSIIAEGTEITGEVKFGSNAEIYGILNAKVMSEDDIITNTGSITGDVVAKNLDMLNAQITGDVATYGDLRLSDASILTGNVAATRMDLRGSLVGNSAIRREINVHSSARLAGDVEAGSIAIGHGARVRGFINVGFDDE